MAQIDVESGHLEKDRQCCISNVVQSLIENLANLDNGENMQEIGTGPESTSYASGQRDENPVVLVESIRSAPSVAHALRKPENGTRSRSSAGVILCIAAGTTIDYAATEILAHFLNSRGLKAKAIAREDLLNTISMDEALENPHKICLLSLASNDRYKKYRFLVRRLRRHFPTMQITVALLGQDSQPSELIEITQVLSSNATTTRFRDTLKLLTSGRENTLSISAQPAIVSA